MKKPPITFDAHLPCNIIMNRGRHIVGAGNLHLEGRAPITVKIGSFCSIGHGVKLFIGGNHRTDWVTTFAFGYPPHEHIFPHHGEGHPTTNGDITLGSDVWLGSYCTIMSGVTIGDGAVVAANAHVVRDVGPYEIVGGNPAKLIRKRFDDAQIEALLKYKWWELSDEKIATLVPYLNSTDIDGAIEKLKLIYESGTK